jgi:hypothetical protein
MQARPLGYPLCNCGGFDEAALPDQAMHKTAIITTFADRSNPDSLVGSGSLTNEQEEDHGKGMERHVHRGETGRPF